jgi:hypothetical protein
LKANAPLDARLLSHHPAGKQCLEACTANGWAPATGDVVRLVKLWSEVREGRRSEVDLSQPHLRFARWLHQTGRINEAGGALDAAA